MKSAIKSKKVKKLIAKAIDNAVEACAFQHEANGKSYNGFEPSAEMKKFANSSPTQVKITLEFYFGEETHNNKHGILFCQPVIDLTGKRGKKTNETRN